MKNMQRRSMKTTAMSFINSLSLLLGLTALFSWIYFCLRLGSWSRYLHPNPLLDLGLFLLGISLLKHILCWLFPSFKRRVAFLASFHMLVFIIIIFAAMVFAMIVTQKGEGREVEGRAYKEYDVNDFSDWFQRYVRPNWIRRYVLHYLSKTPVCTNFIKKFNHLSASEFYNSNLTPLESGCCKPPSFCPFEYKNATIYEIRRSKYLYDTDCPLWENSMRHFWDKFCFYCSSCSGAFLYNVKMEWRYMVFANIYVLIFLILVYFSSLICHK